MAKAKERLTITKTKLVEIFKSIGYVNADQWIKWKERKFHRKLETVAQLDADDKLKEPKDPHLAELLGEILAKIDKDGVESIEVVKKPIQKGKVEEAKRKQIVKDLEETLDEKPHKKKDKDMKTKEKKKKAPKEEEVKKKKKRVVEKEEKPEKKEKKKPGRKEKYHTKEKKTKKPLESSNKVKRDKFGCVVGSRNAKVMACLSRKPKTMAELKEEANETTGFYELLNDKVKHKVIRKTDDGKYALLPKE